MDGNKNIIRPGQKNINTNNKLNDTVKTKPEDFSNSDFFDSDLLDDENLDNKKTKKKKSKQGKKINKLLLIAIIIILVIIAVAVIIINFVPRNSGKHLVFATEAPLKSEDNKDENADSYDSEQYTENNMISLEESLSIPVIVNTKLDGDTEYTDHTSSINIKYNKVVSGYDNVKAYIDDYNANNTNTINITDKESFYNQSIDSELIMFELTLTVPEDFPTNDIKHGYVPIHPEISLSIEGTTEEKEKLVTQLYIYEIPSLTYIGDDISELKVGGTSTIRYICTIPSELKADNYKLILKYKDEKTDKEIQLKSVDIK